MTALAVLALLALTVLVVPWVSDEFISRRLAAKGLARRVGFGRYELTPRGAAVLGGDGR